jgi:hypothetical protein
LRDDVGGDFGPRLHRDLLPALLQRLVTVAHDGDEGVEADERQHHDEDPEDGEGEVSRAGRVCVAGHAVEEVGARVEARQRHRVQQELKGAVVGGVGRVLEGVTL